MKYTRLTKEQLEELHQEFTNFLASQSITADEWKKIIAEKPHLAEEELDVFSDLIWEGVLNKVRFLENNSSKQLSLFAIKAHTIDLIVVKVSHPTVDLLTVEGLHWLENNIASEEVELLTGTKPLSDDKNKAVFELIKQGCVISKGELFTYFHSLMNED